MSAQGYGTDITLIAGADLSAAQYRAVKVNSSGQAVLAGAGEFSVGVLQNKPASGQAATIRISGKSKLIAGGALSAAAFIASDANGKGKAATAGAGTGSNVLGIALEAAGAADQVIAVLLVTAGAIPTTAA